MRKNSIFVNHAGGHTKPKQVMNMEGAVLGKFSKLEWKSVQVNKQVKDIAIMQIYTFYSTEFIFHPVPCTCIKSRSLNYCS